MDLLKLEEAELLEMRRFYEEELEKTLKRMQHLKGVLDKLGGNFQSIQIIVNQSAEVATAELPVTTVSEELNIEEGVSDEQEKTEEETKTRKKRKKKTGPKPFWEDAIMDTLRETGKPLTYEELTDHIQASQNFSDDKRTATKQAITNVVFRLRQRGVKLSTFSAGKKEKYVALKRWFEKDGGIKEEFLNMVAEVKVKKKRGRKSKAELAALANA